MTDEKAPEGFTLEGEKSREKDAAASGIVARDDTLEPDLADEPAPDADGKADGDDDEVVEDTDDTTPIPEDI